MPVRLTKPITRIVSTKRGDLVVTLTPQGVITRTPRSPRRRGPAPYEAIDDLNYKAAAEVLLEEKRQRRNVRRGLTRSGR